MRWPLLNSEVPSTPGPSGATDNASDYGSEDCRFESCLGRSVFADFENKNIYEKKVTPPGGLEPPTFRLTAERASRLRHGGPVVTRLGNWASTHLWVGIWVRQLSLTLFWANFNKIRYGLVVRISGSHPGGPGSIPGGGIQILFRACLIYFITYFIYFVGLESPRPLTWFQKKKDMKKKKWGLSLQLLSPKCLSFFSKINK